MDKLCNSIANSPSLFSIDSLHLQKYSQLLIGALDLKLDNHTGFLVLVDDVWNATQKIQKNIGGISETQQLMKGEKINKNCFD